MKNLTIKQLAAKHNELLAQLIELGVETKVAPVKRFATKEAGIKRNNDLIAAVEAAQAEADYLAAKQAEAKTEAKAPKKATKAGHCDIQPSGYRILPCRAGTKQAKLLDMLSATGGATMEELTEALGWKAVTVRSGFSWDMKNKGYGVKSEEIGDKIVYKIVVPEGEEIPPHTPRKSAK